MPNRAEACCGLTLAMITSFWFGSRLGRPTTTAMISKCITASLVLLVLSVRADDIAAAATPDPDDDVLAAQDNDYLPAARLARTRAARQQETPFPFGLNVPATSPIAAYSAMGLPHASPFLWLRGDLLYSFMSLQC